MFNVCNINFALNASGDWQLTSGGFFMGESSLFHNKVKKKSQLLQAFNPAANS